MNLPCLRGRILFPPHVRENLVDRSRFYVGYDEFTADLEMACLPFHVADSAGTVGAMMRDLLR